jgi:hypothetical protein
MCDNTLRSFLGVIGAKSPKTKFVVYSRGTDVNWTSEKFRAEWKKDLEERFPWLKGRVLVIWIEDWPDGRKGSFKNPATAKEMVDTVKSLLNVSEKAK